MTHTHEEYRDAAYELVADFYLHQQELANKVERILKRNQLVIESYTTTIQREIHQFQEKFPELVDSLLAKKDHELRLKTANNNVVQLKIGGKSE